VLRVVYLPINSFRDSWHTRSNGGDGISETISRTLVSYVISTILGPSVLRASRHDLRCSSVGSLRKTVKEPHPESPTAAGRLLARDSLSQREQKVQDVQGSMEQFQEQNHSSLGNKFQSPTGNIPEIKEHSKRFRLRE
jgi:hypothetical protein